MRPLPKIPPFPALAALLLAMAPLAGLAQEKKEEKKKEDRERAPLDVPIPVGHEAKRIKLPYFDTEGRLSMNFLIESARRLDDSRIEMNGVLMETFDESGKPDFAISLPNGSTLDLKSNIVTSPGAVSIRRSDFHLTGDSMEFNTRTKSGKLFGNIRMILFNESQPTHEP